MFLLYLTAFACLYVLPVLSVYVTSGSKMYVPISMFIISVLLQYMVFNAGSSCVNYMLVAVPVILCFLRQIIVDVDEKKLFLYA